LQVNCARELFKPSKDSAILLVGSEEKFLSFEVFDGDFMSGVGLNLFGRGYRFLGPNHKRDVFH